MACVSATRLLRCSWPAQATRSPGSSVLVCPFPFPMVFRPAPKMFATVSSSKTGETTGEAGGTHGAACRAPFLEVDSWDSASAGARERVDPRPGSMPSRATTRRYGHRVERGQVGFAEDAMECVLTFSDGIMALTLQNGSRPSVPRGVARTPRGGALGPTSRPIRSLLSRILRGRSFFNE